MKIELKNIKVNLAFSEETTCFSADIFVNGKKAGYAKNSGHGGCTDYRPYDAQHGLLNDANDYLKTLPSTPYTFGGKTIEIESNLENFIDNAVEAFLEKKEDAKVKKKIEKLCLTHLVFGDLEKGTYRKLGYANTSIEDLKKRPDADKHIQKLIDTAKPYLVDGGKIFNTNIDLTKYGY